MKHLLTRLREWLIRKLGGYTAPQDLQIRTIQYVSPVRLTSVQIISRSNLMRSDNYSYLIQYAKNKIAADIVKTMRENGQITFSAQHLPNTDIEIRGTVLLYPLDGLEVPPC